MEWPIILALVLIIPIMLIPVAFVWYLNISGFLAVMKGARERQIAQAKETRQLAGAEYRLTEAITEQLVEKQLDDS
ncbi:hypothetical protein ACFLYX_04055 [Chloroflexota bacterium]